MEGCEVAPQPALALPAGRPPSALPHSGSADPLAPCTPAASDAGAGYGDAGVLARAGSAAGQRCAYVTLLTRCVPAALRAALQPGLHPVPCSPASSSQQDVPYREPLFTCHRPAETRTFRACRRWRAAWWRCRPGTRC